MSFIAYLGIDHLSRLWSGFRFSQLCMLIIGAFDDVGGGALHRGVDRGAFSAACAIMGVFAGFDWSGRYPPNDGGP